jgi:catalase
MNAMPAFPVPTVEEFYARQIVTLPDPATGKPEWMLLKKSISRNCK